MSEIWWSRTGGYVRWMALAEFMTDTHPDVVDMLVERWRRLSTTERVVTIESLHRDAEAFALSGVKDRHPDASAEENRLRVIALRVRVR